MSSSRQKTDSKYKNNLIKYKDYDNSSNNSSKCNSGLCLKKEDKHCTFNLTS